MKSDTGSGKIPLKNLNSLDLSSRELGAMVKAFTQKGAPIQFSAKGHSMFPFITDGDTIMISSYLDMSPEVGDIAAFLDSDTGNLIIHRIVALSETEFTTKGDSCFRKDAPQPRNNILGFVSTVNGREQIRHDDCYFNSPKCITLLSRLGLFAILGRMHRASTKRVLSG